MGVILQRATLILLLCCFPCCAVLINIEQLLLLIRQDPEVSRSGGPVARTPLPRPPRQGGAARRVAVVVVPRYPCLSCSPRLTQRYVMAFVPALPVSPCGHPGCCSAQEPPPCSYSPVRQHSLISPLSSPRLFSCITWRQDTCRTRWVLRAPQLRAPFNQAPRVFTLTVAGGGAVSVHAGCPAGALSLKITLIPQPAVSTC